LVGEHESDEGDTVKVSIGGNWHKDMAVTDVNGHVHEAEGGVVLCRGSVFARPTEKENAVHNMLMTARASIVLCWQARFATW
jgi:hypothetical protein